MMLASFSFSRADRVTERNHKKVCFTAEDRWNDKQINEDSLCLHALAYTQYICNTMSLNCSPNYPCSSLTQDKWSINQMCWLNNKIPLPFVFLFCLLYCCKLLCWRTSKWHWVRVADWKEYGKCTHQYIVINNNNNNNNNNNDGDFCSTSTALNMTWTMTNNSFDSLLSLYAALKKRTSLKIHTFLSCFV